MLTEETRKERISHMMSLAKVYRGWTSTQLAAALGREPTRAVPATGNPKLDLLERLADALDWETGEVAESLVSDDPTGEGSPTAVGSGLATRAGGPDRAVTAACADIDAMSFPELDVGAQRSHRSGSYAEMQSIALRMRQLANTGRERAIAANRLAGAYDGLGRYTRVLTCVREALSEEEIGDDLRLMLMVNLANANYTLWNLQESAAVSRGLLAEFESEPPRGRLERVARAFCLSISGHSQRRILARCDSEREARRRALEAERDLVAAERQYAELASEFDDAQYLGLANTARGGALEARVAAGLVPAEDAIEEIVSRLEHAIDVAAHGVPHLLESWGWWSVFGANIAMRADRDAARAAGACDAERGDLEQAIAICTNKAAEIAEHLDLWPMRERAFTLEWFRRQQVVRTRPEELATWTLDTDDVRVLVGTMGRFPLFRPMGWAILHHAEIIESVA
jgi:hypothetical protein